MKKATIIVAFFVSNHFGFAAGKTETYSDLIEKAYNLSLQKDRVHAVGILVQAIKKEQKKGKIPKELAAALKELSQTFYSDKAQQLYEVALSLRQIDPTAALTKLNEASKFDPENLMISLEIARNQIAKNECGKSVEFGKKIKETYALHEEVDLIIVQAAICDGKFSEWDKFRPIDLKKSEYALFWYLTLAEYQFRKNELNLLKGTLNEAAKLDHQNPQVHYWNWRRLKEEKESSEKSGQKYVSECKKLTSRKQRTYFIDPFLCRNVTEVENFLKKNNNLQ